VSDAVAAPLVALAGRLRAGGMRVGSGELQRALHALDAIDPASREQSRLALRAVLCARREDLATFDAAFAALFEAPDTPAPAPPPAGVPRAVLPRVAVAPEIAADVPEPEVVPAAYSAEEVLRDVDFAAYSDAELHAARALLRRLARRGPTRVGRRLKRARRGHRPDLPATLRASLRTFGEPLARPTRAPAQRPRALVLVVDVSGSMAPYARVLLMYAQAAVAARPRVEAFALGTRLTRITLQLRGADQDRALNRALGAVEDYAGGTRIGEALATLNREHGRRLGRGADVVILSDGWDRGEPELLAAEMARLRRSAHRVIWLNPLKATPGYAPLARGMAAALPHTDRFLPGHSLRSLEELADLLEGGLT
jgi:uncharacterized protein with von Willebrand factor type A (vWA) domain